MRGLRLAVLYLVLVTPCQVAAGQARGDGPPRSQLEEPGQECRSKTIVFERWRFSLELPSEKWHLVEKQEDLSADSLASYMYKRKGILDSEGRRIEPVIGLMFEKIPRDLNLIWYESTRRPRKWGFKLEEAFSHEDGTIGLKLALGWLAKYERNGVEHTVKTVCAKDGEIGVRVIMDSTTDVFPNVEKDFDHALKSLRFITSLGDSGRVDSAEEQKERLKDQEQ